MGGTWQELNPRPLCHEAAAWLMAKLKMSCRCLLIFRIVPSWDSNPGPYVRVKALDHSTSYFLSFQENIKRMLDGQPDTSHSDYSTQAR